MRRKKDLHIKKALLEVAQCQVSTSLLIGNIYCSTILSLYIQEHTSNIYKRNDYNVCIAS